MIPEICILIALIVALVLIIAPMIIAARAQRGRFRATEAVEIATQDIPADLIDIFEAAEEKLESMGFQYSHTQFSALEDKGTDRTIMRYYWHPEAQTYAAAYKALERSYPSPFNVTFSTIFETGKVLETDDCTKHLQLPFPDICEHYDHGIGDIDRQWEMHQYHSTQQEFPDKIDMNPAWCCQWQTQLISESLHQMLKQKTITLDLSDGYYRLRWLAAYRMGRKILRGPERALRHRKSQQPEVQTILERPSTAVNQTAANLQQLFRARGVYLTLVLLLGIGLAALNFTPPREHAVQRAASQPPQPIAQTLQTAISPSEEVKDQEQKLARIDADDFQLASVSNTTDADADVEPPKAEEDNSLQARVKHALAERENVLARKNIFVMLDDARADGDYETELGVLEIMATESTPAFSLEERMEFAVDALAVLAESEQPHSEERTIRISQQLANYFDQMGLKAEATELRKQIVIHRRVLAERES